MIRFTLLPLLTLCATSAFAASNLKPSDLDGQYLVKHCIGNTYHSGNEPVLMANSIAEIDALGSANLELKSLGWAAEDGKSVANNSMNGGYSAFQVENIGGKSLDTDSSIRGTTLTVNKRTESKVNVGSTEFMGITLQEGNDKKNVDKTTIQISMDPARTSELLYQVKFEPGKHSQYPAWTETCSLERIK